MVRLRSGLQIETRSKKRSNPYERFWFQPDGSIKTQRDYIVEVGNAIGELQDALEDIQLDKNHSFKRAEIPMVESLSQVAEFYRDCDEDIMDHERTYDCNWKAPKSSEWREEAMKNAAWKIYRLSKVKEDLKEVFALFYRIVTSEEMKIAFHRAGFILPQTLYEIDENFLIVSEEVFDDHHLGLRSSS